MDVEDLLSSEVAVAVAATAAVLSPRVQRLVRRGVVYGLAGVLMVGDAVGAAVGGVARRAQDGVTTAGMTAEAPGNGETPGVAGPAATEASADE
jgi:hypothetical protein